MENIKIKTPNPEIGYKVQEKAFKLGCKLSPNTSGITGVLSYYLYITENIITFSAYQSDGLSGLQYFNNHPNTEVTWQDFLYKDVGYTEITFDQFKRLVLKQTDNKMDEIVLKCIKSPVRAKNITENNTYTGIYIDEEETQVDSYDGAVYFLCENNRGVQARYNIDLFEKPVVVKPIITLDTLLNYLKFTDTSIKFKDGVYELVLVNNSQTYLLKSSQAANSCGIYLIGAQGDDGGVDNLYDVIYDAVNDGAWRKLEVLYEIQGGSDEIIFKIFSEYVKWKMSTLSAGFFILSTNSDSATVELLDKMECLKTKYSVNPNSSREIKMWIFDNAISMEEDDEEEVELPWG